MARIFGGIIAVFLLGLYVYAIVVVLRLTPCGATPCRDVSEPVATILSLVGGLVSALVIAVLGITQPGKSFSQALRITGSGQVTKIVDVVVAAFLVVWLVCGVLLMIGWIKNPDPVPELVAAAKTWLGLAVGAAYAYFGLQPPEERRDGGDAP